MTEYEGKGGQFMLVLDRGENLVECITEFASRRKMNGGTISGLGALMDVELGYYDLEKKEYIRKTFDDADYELISLTGNLSLKGGSEFAHVHASLGRNDFSVFGGHLFEAQVAVTAEVYIHPLGVMPERKPNEKIGLDLICGFVK